MVREIVETLLDYAEEEEGEEEKTAAPVLPSEIIELTKTVLTPFYPKLKELAQAPGDAAAEAIKKQIDRSTIASEKETRKEAEKIKKLVLRALLKKGLEEEKAIAVVAAMDAKGMFDREAERLKSLGHG